MNRDHVVSFIAGILRANGHGDVLECVQDAESIVGTAENRGEKTRENARAVRAAGPGAYPAPVPNGFSQWPSIEFPAWLRSLGFEDRSYRNDACGRAEFPLAPGADENGYPKMQCWVEHEDFAEREHGGPRFELDVIVRDNEEGDVLYQGDDPDACEAAFWTWWDQHADEYPVEHAPARGPKE